jgi:hypothetical protein
MATVTYVNQPAIHKTRGCVPLAGTAHVYTVNKILWPKEVEDFLSTKLVGHTLHACCGKSQLGDVRLDLYEPKVDVTADAARLPFADNSFDTVQVDPPYNGAFQWQHDMLSELPRVARIRIIHQHWYIPANKIGLFKKNHTFVLSETNTIIEVEDTDFTLAEAFVWMPRTYFGRTQIISIFDKP